MKAFIEIIKNKKVLFITTKNIDYIRNTQEIRLLKENAQTVEIVCSDRKNYIFRILDVWRKITKQKVAACDVVFLGFEPQFVLPYLGRKFRAKTVISDFFISVYDTLVCDRKKLKKGSLPAKYCHHIDCKTLALSDNVIADTDAHAAFFMNEFKADPEKFETLYLEADRTIYYPRLQNKTEEQADKFVVLYFGSILPLQGVDTVLEAVRLLKDRDGIYFDIIGPIPEHYHKPIQENAHYPGWLEQEQLAEHIANADLCLSGHFNGTIAKAGRTIAGKTYIYEMMRKKIVLGDGPANHELFREDEMHRFVEMSSAEKLTELILQEESEWRKNHSFTF